MKKLFLLLVTICVCSCQPDPIPALRDPLVVASDPNNIGAFSGGDQMGMCYGYAWNLMYRLNHETDAKAWLMTVTGVGDPEPEYHPEKIKRHIQPVPHEMLGIWGHAVVLFQLPDGEIYIDDENVNRAIHLDMDKFWHNNPTDINNDFANWAVKELWRRHAHVERFDFNNFTVSFTSFLYGKRDTLDDFDGDATGYFVGQDHPYYFPPDWCVD